MRMEWKNLYVMDYRIARPKAYIPNYVTDDRCTPKNISAATVARTAVLGLALTNQLLSAAGKPVLPIESTQVEQLVSAGFTIGAALASWWYNNSFTQDAIKADEEFERQKKRV